MSGRQINYREAYGVFTATAAIVACDLYVMLNEYMWDWVFMLVVAISILLVFFWTGIYTAFASSAGFYKAAPEVYGTLVFWAFLLLAILACLLPRFSIKAYQKMYWPRDVDIIRENVRQHMFDYLKTTETSSIQEKEALEIVNVDELNDINTPGLAEIEADIEAQAMARIRDPRLSEDGPGSIPTPHDK